VGRGTALINAAYNGHALVVEQLIAAGAGLDVKDNDGYEPIYPTATAVRCIRAGSQLSRQGYGAHLGRSKRSHKRDQAAHRRGRRPRCQRQRWVRANIPDCNGCAISEPAADFLGRGTALIWAAEKGHTLVVEQLIAAGAGLDVKENNG
jgi:hypothetical protein